MAKKGEEAEKPKPKPNLRETVASTLKELNQSDSRHRSRSRSPGMRSTDADINKTIGTSLSRSLSQVAGESLTKNANQKEKEKESDSDVCPWSQAAVGISIGINKNVYTNYKENDRWGPGTTLDQTGPEALNWNQRRPKLSPSPSPDRGGFNFKRSPGMRSADADINKTIGISLSRSLSQVAQESLTKKNANQKENEKESDSDVCPWSQAAVGIRIGIDINKNVYTNYKENDRWGPGTTLDQTGPEALNWNQPRPKLSPSPSPDRGGFNFKRSRGTGWDESHSPAPKSKCRRTGWDLDKSRGRDNSYDSCDPWMCIASLHATGTGTGTHSVNPFGESNRQNHPIKDDVSCLACNIFRSAPWCGSNSLKSTLTCTCTSTTAGTVTGTETESSVNPGDPTPKVPKLLVANTTDRHSFKRALITFAKPKLRPFWLKQHVNDLVYLHILARFVKNVVHSLGTRIPQTHDICKFLREENDSLSRYLQMYLRRFVSDHIIKNMRYDRRSPEKSLVFP